MATESLMDSLAQARALVNRSLSSCEPLVLVFSPFLAFFVAFVLLPSFFASLRRLRHHGIQSTVSSCMVDIASIFPGVRKHIQKEKQKVVEKMHSSRNSQHESRQVELPGSGLGIIALEKLKALKSKDLQWQGRSSGAVYIGGGEKEGHFTTVNEAYAMFSHTNPLHSDLFPSISRLETEVVAMTASILGGKNEASGGQICGNMTSGGTESILMAVKSSRDYMRAIKGITKPEMIIPNSAHAAYDKAAEYFGIKLWRTPVNKDFRADTKSIKSLINKNTILIVGSAPGFPHGVIDPIQELGALALQKGVLFHVDLCLGGFILPFARKLGYPIPEIDFTVPGVTSISVDIHKYGLGPKGSSVVLYRNHEIRMHQFVAVTEWSGGLYISPSMAGSRPGGLIAGAWASMMALGLDGYMESAKLVLEASEKMKRGIGEIPGLYVLGEPQMTVIAFASHEVDIFKVNDAMTSKGWSLNALQKPNSMHFCVTLQHVNVVEDFLKDLFASVNTVKESPGAFEDGMAPIYGAAAKMPDRTIVKDLLVAYMDGTC